MYFAVPHSLSRRAFLRGAGVTLALPLLDAMQPAFARAPKTVSTSTTTTTPA